MGFVLISLDQASHYFRSDLYALAIQYESEKAQLTANNTQINQQEYYYLSQDKQHSSEIVVLLHGFSANKENWLRFSQNLPQHYQVIAIDLLGHGQHEINLDLNYSIETQVDYLHTFITKVIQQPIHIVGNSMGGAIASLYAATYPDDVKTLMLISPAGVHDIPSDMDKILEDGANPLIASSVDQFYKVVDFVMSDKPFIPKPILLVQAEHSVDRFALNQKIFSDIRKDLDKHLDQKFPLIKAPTLILWGKEDRVINVENIHRYTSLIADSKSDILEGIGHLAMLEAPEISAKAFIKLSSNTN
tara:strand:- start:640 stop:1548 length:909 start_codon:yes stop_codon:yes gene_type:complete